MVRMYGKQTDRKDCGIRFVVAGPGRTGGIYSNPKDLKQYIKKKVKEGYKLDSVDWMKVSNGPHYLVRICKDPRDWGVE